MSGRVMEAAVAEEGDRSVVSAVHSEHSYAWATGRNTSVSSEA